MKIYTIGYEGLSIGEFVDFLAKKKIRLVADIRKNPISRKKGFSKHKMAANLALRQIAYAHFRDLGVPTEWRKKAKKKEITRKKMFSDYQKKILPVSGEAIEQLIGLAETQKVALLCYEMDASDCHRRFVTEALKKKKKGLEIIDLEVPRPKGTRLFGS